MNFGKWRSDPDDRDDEVSVVAKLLLDPQSVAIVSVAYHDDNQRLTSSQLEQDVAVRFQDAGFGIPDATAVHDRINWLEQTGVLARVDDHMDELKLTKRGVDLARKYIVRD